MDTVVNFYLYLTRSEQHPTEFSDTKMFAERTSLLVIVFLVTITCYNLYSEAQICENTKE